MSKDRKHNHWYEGITEAVQMYIPGNRMYRTIQARRARTGTLFILPLIIGFLAFMVRPLFLSLQMSMIKAAEVEGPMSPFNLTMNLFGQHSADHLGNSNYSLDLDPGIS